MHTKSSGNEIFFLVSYNLKYNYLLLYICIKFKINVMRIVSQFTTGEDKSIVGDQTSIYGQCR
jgi:hypothetical protein